MAEKRGECFVMDDAAGQRRLVEQAIEDLCGVAWSIGADYLRAQVGVSPLANLARTSV